MALVLALGTGLSACGEPPTATLNTQIDEGHATQALKTLEAQLAENPTDPLLLALTLKASLMACAEVDCPATAPAMLATIAGYAAQVPGPVALNDTITLTPSSLYHQAALQLAQLPTYPASVLALINHTPEALRPNVADALWAAPLKHLRAGKTALAAGQLQALSNAEGLSSALRTWALLGYGFATRQNGVVQSAVIGLRNEPKTTLLPPTAPRLLPHVMLVPANNQASTLSQLTPAIVASWKIPFLTPETFVPAADELNHMHANAQLVERLSGQSGTPALTSTTTVFKAGALTQLHLMRLSLALNPNQPDLWATFLPLASKAQQATPNLNLLAGVGAPTQPPAPLMDPYLATLFRLLEVEAARNGDMLPLLTHVGTLKLDTPTAVKLEKMVQEGLENAAATRNIPQIEAYAAFKPNVARNTKAVIVPPVVEAIRTALQTGQYPQATRLGTLLEDTLAVDFNFNNLMLAELDAQFRTDGTLDALSSDTPDALLQPETTAKVDLGNLWAFAQAHTAAQPDVLDNQLKSMVANAHGMYGLPTALHRLGSYFNETLFTPQARRTYLNKAIVQSLLADDKLSGPHLADAAWRLSRIHTGLSLATVLDAAVTRTTTLDDSRTLWNNAPAAVRQTLQSVRPAFASLMRGIDAWDAHRTGAAAEAFAELDATYATQAEPYLLKLRNLLMNVNGLYVPANPARGLTTGLIAITVPALSGQGALADVQATFTNTLGSTHTINTKTLTTDYAALTPTTLTLPLDFTTLSVTLGGDTAFTTLYGPLRTLRFHGTTLTATDTHGKPHTFHRLYANAQALGAPQGTYAVRRQTSKPNAATDALLPVGSILTLATNANPTNVVTAAENLGNVYPLKGTLKHPGSPIPLEVEGYFNPSNHTFSVLYTPPLLKGGSTKAALRCQVLGPTLLCGAHHLHSNRAQFTHQVVATQTEESARKQAQQAAQENTLQTETWSKLSAAALLQSNAQPEPEIEPEPTLTSATTVSGSAPVSATLPATSLLPPPDFLATPTKPVSSSGL
ncbi:MAG: hypothetical protein WAZ18_00935 [Alphaproteobacteria bacterium]